jgi:LacI family transcriptional regulator
LPLDERLVAPIGFHDPDADEQIAALLDVEKPTAIFAPSNQLAERAWHVLQHRRQILARDISLVAFDDLPWMSMVTPAITVVSQPTVEMGRRAARLLLHRTTNPDTQPRLEQLQPTLLIRHSTARPAAS